MFNSRQKEILNILGVVSDSDRYNCYEAFCENEFELRANGAPGYGSFTKYLEGKLAFAEFVAKRNNQKALEQL